MTRAIVDASFPSFWTAAHMVNLHTILQDLE
jgi:hypothetical protein